MPPAAAWLCRNAHCSLVLLVLLVARRCSACALDCLQEAALAREREALALERELAGKAEEAEEAYSARLAAERRALESIRAESEKVRAACLRAILLRIRLRDDVWSHSSLHTLFVQSFMQYYCI